MKLIAFSKGLTQQAWVVQTLHIPNKGLALTGSWKVISEPLESYAWKEYLCLPMALGHSTQFMLTK